MGNRADLTSAPLPGLIRMLAVPASIGFIFNTLFNVVDTYFGGLISTAALAALSLSFPVFFIILSLGIGMGTGTTALISNALGEGKERKAQLYGIQAISFSFFNAIFLTAFGIFIAPYLFRLMGATDEYLAISVSYINIILYGTLFFLINSILNAILQSRGDTKTNRNFLILGFFLNLGLDPWFLYGGLGIPAMGIKGIALATILIQFVGSVYMFWVVWKKGHFKGGTFTDLIPRRKYYIHLFQQGFPASLNMLTIALGIFLITFFAGRFGQEAVAAYGIATRIEQIALLPTIGLNIAALTLAGQNMGAGLPFRVLESWKLNLRYGLYIMTAGMILVFLFAQSLISFFTTDTLVIQIGREYLRIAAFFFLAYVFLNISVSTLQGIKKPMYAIWIGLYRQIALPLPLFYFLAVMMDWGTKGIWWSIFIVNWSAAIFTFFYTRKKISKVLNLYTSKKSKITAGDLRKASAPQSQIRKKPKI